MPDSSPPLAERMTVLHIEDYDPHARLLKRLIEEIREISISMERRPDLASGLASLASRSYDTVFLDLNLRDSRGLETFTHLRLRHPQQTVIVLSSLADHELATYALRDGAQDFLVKETLDVDLLRRSLLYARERARLQNEARDALKKLKIRSRQLAQATLNTRAIAQAVSSDLQLPVSTLVHYAVQLDDPGGCDPVLARTLTRAIRQVSTQLEERLRRFSAKAQDALSTAAVQPTEFWVGAVDLESALMDATSECLDELQSESLLVTSGNLGRVLGDRLALTDLFIGIIRWATSVSAGCSQRRLVIDPMGGTTAEGLRRFVAQVDRIPSPDEGNRGSFTADERLRRCSRIIQHHGGELSAHASGGRIVLDFTLHAIDSTLTTEDQEP